MCEKMILVSVEDNGCGIKEEDKESGNSEKKCRTVVALEKTHMEAEPTGSQSISPLTGLNWSTGSQWTCAP